MNIQLIQLFINNQSHIIEQKKQDKREQQPKMCNQSQLKPLQLSQRQTRQANDKFAKMLTYIFTRNLEHFLRVNRRALPQAQQPLKIRLKKQEQALLSMNHRRVYQQHHNKLVRESLQRNSHIQNSRNLFRFHYFRGRVSQDQTSKQPGGNVNANGNIQDAEYKVTILPPKRCLRNNNSIRLKENTKAQTSANSSSFKVCTRVTTFNKIKQCVRHRRNTSNVPPVSPTQKQDDILTNSQQIDSKYPPVKFRKRNNSMHCQVQAIQHVQYNQPSQFYFQQGPKFRINQNIMARKLYTQCRNDMNLDSFSPFYGLNTRDIFVRKPLNNSKLNNQSKNLYNRHQIQSKFNSTNYNFSISRSTIHGRVAINKNMFSQKHCSTLRQNNLECQYFHKNGEEIKQQMRQKFMKISSDLAIKTLQPQGYKGKSRPRYQSFNQAK